MTPDEEIRASMGGYWLQWYDSLSGPIDLASLERGHDTSREHLSVSFISEKELKEVRQLG